MKKSFVLSLAMIAAGVAAADVAVKGPDGRLEFRLRAENGVPEWSAAYDGRSVAEWSPLGLETEYGDFTKGVKLGEGKKRCFRDAYTLPQGKRSKVKVEMNMAVVPLLADNAKLGFEVCVGNNDLAFRYFVEKATTVRREATGFAFASGAKMFATQQSKPMTGFAQTKPSYEETYVYDAELGTKSGNGEGWTFPMLMRLPGDGGAKDLWALVSETGTDGNYCGCRLADWENGCFRIAFPMAGEARGKGAVEPKCAARTSTPWRTLTVGDSLAPIVETTIAYDIVKPVVPAPKKPYEFGRGSWSWIVWDDASMNAADQRKFIDLAAEMGWEHILIDAFWDRIPAEEFDALLAYAKERKVAVYLWYNSNGDWNDAPQTPKNRFNTRESTEKEMAWLESKGVRGVKVDFWGGDKQFVIAKYCELFEIANKHHIQVIVHGCTLPRGWERMYPNFVGAEALLASENAKFSDWGMGSTPQWAATHPFCRNAFAIAEYGPVFLNKFLRADNKSGVKRITTDGFELATAVTYQNPVQNFALTPNNLTDAPRDRIEFMKKVPTVWDESRYVAGYPGKFAVIARRSGKTWYVAGVAAEDVETEIDLSFAGGTREKIKIARADGFVRTLAAAGKSTPRQRY